MFNPYKVANHLLTLAKTSAKNINPAIRIYARPVLGVAVQMGLILAIYALPSLAQGPNPFGGNGGTKLANAGSNIMVYATWLAGFVGLLSFILIPIFIKFGMDYKKLIISGVTGCGGAIIIGSIAYDIVNLSSTNMSDPTLGK